MGFRLCCVGVKLWIIFELEAFCTYKAACKIKTELDTVKTDIYDPRTQSHAYAGRFSSQEHLSMWNQQ